MSVHTFEEMLSHAGHKIECVYYGTEHQAVNTAIECITCGQVLIDLSPGQVVGVDDAESSKISVSWCVEDVVDRARDTDINITEQQAKEILGEIERQHDCTIGITWDTIDAHLDKLGDIREIEMVTAHCESCGQGNPTMNDGYTCCCNELCCQGDNKDKFGFEDDYVVACCWAKAEEKFKAQGREIKTGMSRLW